MKNKKFWIVLTISSLCLFGLIVTCIVFVLDEEKSEDSIGIVAKTSELDVGKSEKEKRIDQLMGSLPDTERELIFLEAQQYTVTTQPDNFTSYSSFLDFDPTTFSTWVVTGPRQTDASQESAYPAIDKSELMVDYETEMLVVSYGRELVSLSLDTDAYHAYLVTFLHEENVEEELPVKPQLIGIMGAEYHPNTAFIYKTPKVEFWEALPVGLYDRWRYIEGMPQPQNSPLQ